ncbi:MAG: hypothetical protein ACR2LA_05505, partial [Acidimicrobiales bacterium]
MAVTLRASHGGRVPQSDPADRLVEATERLYQTLFSVAIGYGLAMMLWAGVIAPFNRFDHSKLGTELIAVGLFGLAMAAYIRRRALFFLLRGQPAWLTVPTVLGIAALWLDGGWRSSLYLASYTGVALAAVTAGVRRTLLIGAVLACGYVAGLALNGYTWGQLVRLNDADSVVANTGGYLISAYFLAAPVAWIGGYVARINQLVG